MQVETRGDGPIMERDREFFEDLQERGLFSRGREVLYQSEKGRKRDVTLTTDRT